MTPINSMLPIAAAGAGNVSGEAAAETSPLAGFGELIAGLILQGEASVGSSAGSEDGDGQPALTEEQVATAMLLTSLSSANEQPPLDLLNQLVAPGVDLEADAVAEEAKAGVLGIVPPVVEGTTVVVPSVAGPVDAPPSEPSSEILPTPTPPPNAPGDQKGLTAADSGGQLAPTSNPVAAQPQTPTVAPEGEQVHGVANGTPAQPHSPPTDAEASTPAAREGVRESVPHANLGDSNRSPSPNPASGTAQPPVTEQPGLVPNSPATAERQVAPSPPAEHQPIPTVAMDTPVDQSRPAADVAASPAAPNVVPPSQPSTVQLPSTLVARVEQAIEMIENAPPPRQITIEADDLDGIRLTVALRPDGVSVSSQTADSSVLDAIERALAARGFDLSDSGRDRRHAADQEDLDGWRPTAAPRTRQESRDQGIRL